jgi:hypothetical protein
MSQSLSQSTAQVPQVLSGICSVCNEYRVIFHRVELPRSKKVLVQYCSDCFE